MDNWDLQAVAQFIDILDHYTGCDSPVEEFIIDQVRSHYLGCPLTPDGVARDLDQFRENFNDALETARHFLAKYPALVNGSAEAN